MERTQNVVSEIEISYTPKQLNFSRPKITCSQDIYEILKELFDTKLFTVKEECIALFLNRNNIITGWYKVSSGGITGTVVDTRLILSIALKSLSCGLVLAHTHPSGNLKPSKADRDITSNIREAAKLMDIRLLDHLIITSDWYYSFADEGELINI
jgi:DNA repair protein RadC